MYMYIYNEAWRYRMAFFVQVIVTCMEQIPIHLLYSHYDGEFSNPLIILKVYL